MKKYTNEDPVFHEEIDIYEATDPVDAESVDNVPLKQLQDNILNLKKNGAGYLDTRENVQAMADELMEGGPSPTPTPGDEIATDEEVDDMIDHLDDL